MVCRKHSMTFMELLRGAYVLDDPLELAFLLYHVTQAEQHLLQTKTFDELWNLVFPGHEDLTSRRDYQRGKELWLQLCSGVPNVGTWIHGPDPPVTSTTTRDLRVSVRVSAPEHVTRSYIRHSIPLAIREALREESVLTWAILLQRLPSPFKEPEWGFPKGRRNPNESEWTSACREFHEETRLSDHDLRLIPELPHMVENYWGSNGTPYQSKYFICESQNDQLPEVLPDDPEISAMRWVPLFSEEGSPVQELFRPLQMTRDGLVRELRLLVQNYTPFLQ